MILQNINPYLGIHDQLPFHNPWRACLDQKGVHHSFPRSLVASIKALTPLEHVQTEQ